jgi:putative FmdB family regulatory protein
MPIYEYACEKCNKHFEIMQKITDESLTTCSDCKGKLKKKMSKTSFVLKGTGWYATDYASNKGRAPKTTTSQKQKDSAPQTTATAEKKTGPKETKTEAKEPAVSGK